MLRYRLGRDISGVNLVQNGTFSNGFTSWDVTTGWGVSGSGATSSAPPTWSVLEQDNILVRGLWYRMKFKVIQPFDSLLVVPPVLREYRNYGTGEYSYDFQATLPINHDAIGFLAQSTGTITNIELYTLQWNPFTTMVDVSDFEYTIERDSDLEGVITEFSGDIVFGLDGYRYLSSLDGFCQEIPVLVEKFKNNTWLPYIEGVIFLSIFFKIPLVSFVSNNWR